jgi:tetratricopeptide (TPR) repeat protein
LIRLYASDLADAELDAGAAEHARRRMLDHYLHTAARADRLMHPRRAATELGPAAAGAVVTTFVNAATAGAWMDRELSTVAAVVEAALAHGFEPYARQRPWPLTEQLDEHGAWPVLTRLAELAIATARQTGDSHAEALARTDAALGRHRLGHHDRGLDHLEHSRSVLHEVGDKPNLARAERIAALICETLGRHDEQAHHARRALDLARAVGDPAAEAGGHTALAWAQVLRGNYESAIDHALDGLALHRRTGDPVGEGDVLGTIAFLNYRRGFWEPTLEYYHRAEAVYGSAGARHDQLRTIARISTVHARTGDAEAAERRLREALGIADELGLVPEDAVAEANAVMARFESR